MSSTTASYANGQDICLSNHISKVGIEYSTKTIREACDACLWSSIINGVH